MGESVTEIGTRKTIEEGLGGVVKVQVRNRIMNGSYSVGATKTTRWAVWIEGEARRLRGIYRTMGQASDALMTTKI